MIPLIMKVVPPLPHPAMKKDDKLSFFLIVPYENFDRSPSEKKLYHKSLLILRVQVNRAIIK